MNEAELTCNGLVKPNTERPSFENEPLLSQVHETYEIGLILRMRYIEHLLPFSNSLKIKEALINHDEEIKERVCILLWQYIVTLEHGTHLFMHFSTWVVRLSSSPTNS